MKHLPIQRAAIEPRIDGIQKELVLLKEFVKEPFNKFGRAVIFDRAQLHLRFALEGVFNIGSHILARIPGGRFTEYKEIARKLGATGVVTKDFAEGKLVLMAGYRNRLTHFYTEIGPAELYKILQTDLDDIEYFLRAIKKVMEHPEKFGLRIE